MGSFYDQMDAILRGYDQRFDALVQGTTIELYKVIVERTPLKTGRTRGNYIISPTGRVIDDFNPDRFDKDGSANLPMAQEAIKSIKAGGVVRIINGTPYAMELEFGYSRQAPSGMVRVSVFDFEPIVHKIAKELLNSSASMTSKGRYVLSDR